MLARPPFWFYKPPMTKQFCDCCERELTSENQGIVAGASADMGSVTVNGQFTMDVRVTHTGGRGQDDKPDICRPCIMNAISAKNFHRPA